MDWIAIDNWPAQVQETLDRCLRNPANPASLLGEVFTILVSGPANICEPIRPDISKAALQELLDVGAFESAALRLVDKCGYLLSRGRDGQAIASVVLPAAQNDFSFIAASEPVALCGALITCIQRKLSAQ